MDIPITFGEWLKHRRKELDLTQAELARSANCSVNTLRKIEAGDRRPSKQLAELLAQSLEIPSEEQTAFIRVAREELNIERIQRSAHVPSSVYKSVQKHEQSPGNLHVMLTAFFGREPELASLSQLLRNPECRLLTIVGPGGVGKTRLAIEIAARHQDIFPDGVWFISLAPLRSSAFIVPAIADALNFKFQAPGDPQAQLLKFLRDKRVLLVLDNVEHLLDGAELFAEILKNSSQLKLLITSREKVNLLSEYVFEIQGLPMPPSDLADDLEEYSSVALFLQSAQRMRAGFKLHEEDRRWVVQICRLVEGLPLGIELAAGWINLLTCQEVKEELERDLGSLTSPFRDLPERHHSLLAVFDHSWNLLSPKERLALCRLSVFQGGFTRDAAQRVAEAPLGMLSALVDKSLLRRKENERFDLHELIRQYASTHLAEYENEEELTRQRHSSYYLELIQNYKAQFKSSNQKPALAALNIEIDNLRLAWEWAVERRRVSEIRQSVDALWRFYAYQSWFHEGIPVFEKVIEVFTEYSQGDGSNPSAEYSNVVGQALAKQAWFNFRLGRLEPAIQMFRQSITLLKPLDDKQALAFSLTSLGGILAINNNDPLGNEMLEESLAISYSIADPWLTAVTLSNMAIAAMTWRGCEEAYRLSQDAVKAARAAGDPAIIAFCLTYSGLAAFTMGDLNGAYDLISESLTFSRACDNRWDIATALGHLGQIASTQKKYLEAKDCFRQSMEIFAEQGELLSQARTLNQYGEAVFALGNHLEARRNLHAGLRIAMENQSLPIALASLLGLASIFIREGNPLPAVELLARVCEHPASEKEIRERSSKLLNELRLQLSFEQFENSLVQSMPFEAFVESILQN